MAALEALGLAQPERAHVAVFAGTTPTSSAFTNNLGALRTAGFLAYPGAGRLQLTEAGRRAARKPDALPSRAALQEAWFSRLPPARGRLLRALIACYPAPQSRETLADSAGVSAGSSSFTNNLGALRSLGLISYPKSGHVAATDVLFPAGLA